MSGGDADRDLVAEEEERLRRSGIEPRRMRNRAGLDEGTRRLALTAGGLGVALAALVGGWSLLNHRPRGIPVIEPPPGPIRIKPVDPGGMQVSAPPDPSDGADSATTLAPPPEQAHPELLRERIAAARRAQQLEAGAPPATPPAAPVPAPAPVPASGPGSGPVAAGTPTHEAPAAAAPPATIPAPAPAPAPDAAGTAETDAPPPAEPGPPPLPRDGGRSVQLAALDSEAAARAEWLRLSRQAPALLERRTPVFVPVEANGRRFVRLRVGGFADVAEATRFCGALKSRNVSCTLADF